MQDDEAELLAAWQAGDQAAAQTLAGRIRPDMLRFFLAATGYDEQMAEDLVQDTLLVALDHRDDMKTTFRAYCFGVARLKRYEVARRLAKRARHEDPEIGPLMLESPTGVSDEVRQRSKRAIAVLRRLEADQQLLLVLKDYLGFTQAELAETFKIKQSRIAGWINRARDRFRDEYAKLERDPAGWELTMRSLSSALASIVAKAPAERVSSPRESAS